MQPKQTKPKPWLAITLIIFFIVLAAVVWKILIPTYFPGTIPNYTQEVAKPLEAALANAGAVKKCSRGDNGRGSDNDMPWYTAIYEVPVGRKDAVKLVVEAAKATGYSLTDDSSRAVAGDNTLLADRTSKISSYKDLQDGNVSLLFTVYGSKEFSGETGVFCSVKEDSNPSEDKTTFDFTVNLPAFKR